MLLQYAVASDAAPVTGDMRANMGSVQAHHSQANMSCALHCLCRNNGSARRRCSAWCPPRSRCWAGIGRPAAKQTQTMALMMARTMMQLEAHQPGELWFQVVVSRCFRFKGIHPCSVDMLHTVRERM